MGLNGVRTAPLARFRGRDGAGMERAMALSLRESVHLVSDPKNLESSVEEVFQMMVGVRCQLDSGPAHFDGESVTAVVGFGGVLSGACVFRTGGSAAIEIAARMTGSEFGEIDDTVKDAIGEICNMLAGSWKSKVPQLSANCGLSIPAVITGSNYKLHVQAPEFRLDRSYRFEDACFEVTIICDGLQ
jgi:chemotaxis protein CheX